MIRRAGRPGPVLPAAVCSCVGDALAYDLVFHLGKSCHDRKQHRPHRRRGINIASAQIPDPALEAGLDAAHGFVDGHDFGSGEMNIFVHTDLPFAAFQDAQASLSIAQRWGDLRAAFRSTDSDLYTVVWPETLLKFSVS